jgi:ubiquinone/menaquinone biosynthesis C-methylase UbiE
LQADAAALPFPALSFDFISCQFAFHHFQAKADMLCAASLDYNGDGMDRIP